MEIFPEAVANSILNFVFIRWPNYILEEQKRHFELKLAQKDKEIAERDAEIKYLKEMLSSYINITN
jgi:hypothetical protein